MPSIAQDVRTAIVNGASDRAILEMLADRHPGCANPAHTVSYYRSEARNGPRRRQQETALEGLITMEVPAGEQLPPALSCMDGVPEAFDPAMLDQARRFGLEFEFKSPRQGDGERYRDARYWAGVVRQALAPWPEQQIGDNVGGYYHSSGETWDVKADGSCEWELATPALTAADWPKVQAVLSALVRDGARVDNSCGFHVHHEARSAGVRGRGFLGRLIRLWGALDVPLHEALPASRRGNSYAERWARGYADELGGRANLSGWIRELGRYQALNLTNWWRRGLVEVRSHHGTLDAQKAGWWLLATQRVVGFAQQATDQQVDQLLGRVLHQPTESAYLRWTAPRLWALARQVVGDAVQRTLARWTADRNPEHYRLAFAA